MFEDAFDAQFGQYRLSSIESIRGAALIMYGRFIAHMSGDTPDDERAQTCTNYLSLQETENIVREHSVVVDDGAYAIGGDTPEDAKAQINKLLSALVGRVMSNVFSAGVKQELLDCSYDADANDFTFSVTEKGKKVAAKSRKARNNVDKPDIPRDQEL